MAYVSLRNSSGMQLRANGGLFLNRTELSDVPTTNILLDLNPGYRVFSDNGLTQCSNNQAVYRWNDYSTNNSNFIQTSSSARPIFKTGGLDSKPYVHFTGTDWMASELTSLFMQDDLTIFLVAVVNSSFDPYDTLVCRTSDYNWSDGWNLYTNASQDHVTMVRDYHYYEIINTQGAHTVQQIRSFRFKRSAGTQYNKNRVNNGTDNNGTTTNVNNTTVHKTMIGGTWDSAGTNATFMSDLHLYRLLIYNTYFDDATYLSVLNSLNNIYTVY